MDQVELFSVVLQVATDTVFAIRIGHLKPRVIPVLCGQALRYFLVAVEAFECRGAGAELVAARALGRPAEGLVGFGKRAWRDLRLGEIRRNQ